ncbi:nuclear transport factor 2 family protein [Nakamurella deserti]|uniref:nuclear transport factor 2 family protein n=1 Tax=Nakamurella deserti TaxID=2164074 RepID=UPI000DBE17C0|nr:nuclear transport factor 2 family protein [Nakamurella deserti]
MSGTTGGPDGGARSGGAGPAADRPGDGPAPPAAPGATDDEALRRALENAEDRLRHAMLDGDVVTLGELLDDHIVYTGPDGRQVSKQQDLDAYASGAVEITDYDEQHRSVRVIGRTGLTWILTEVRGRAGAQPFGARLRYTRTWVYDTGWRVVAAHASFAHQR